MVLIIDGKWSNELHRHFNDGCLDGADSAGLHSPYTHESCLSSVAYAVPIHTKVSYSGRYSND